MRDIEQDRKTIATQERYCSHDSTRCWTWDTLRDYMAEVERLRAENETLLGGNKEWRADVEPMRDWNMRLRDENMRLRAEVERLKDMCRDYETFGSA